MQHQAERLRIIFNFSHRCSMDCEWCYVPFGKLDVSHEQCVDVIARISDLGFRVLTLGGGDPTSYPFWPDLVRKAKEGGLFVHLDTNGIGLRETEAREALHFVDLLGLPLDGPSACIHNAVRNTSRNHFSDVIKKARWAKDYAPIKINTVVTRDNIVAIASMVPLIADIGPTRWSLYQYWPLSLGARVRSEHEIPDGLFDAHVSQIPDQLGKSIKVEKNPRLSRRLTYPFVSHTGELYVHHPEFEDQLLSVGSIFQPGAIDRALGFCIPDRPVAQSRYY